MKDGHKSCPISSLETIASFQWTSLIKSRDFTVGLRWLNVRVSIVQIRASFGSKNPNLVVFMNGEGIGEGKDVICPIHRDFNVDIRLS